MTMWVFFFFKIRSIEVCVCVSVLEIYSLSVYQDPGYKSGAGELLLLHERTTCVQQVGPDEQHRLG